MSTIVVALGGNAILRPGEKGTYQEQMANVSLTAKSLVQLVKDGYEVVVTHGNGPQVGNVLIQNEAAKSQVPVQPLDVCGAQTQGQIGYMIQHCLDNYLKSSGLNIPVVSIITRVRVDSNDPAFSGPTKPIGPFFDGEHAAKKIAKGEAWTEDSGRGWRRVVPSPKPLEIVEIMMIKAIINSGGIVIAGGGGGIPVVEDDGLLKGVEAVIDKDSVACRLACDLKANVMLILTDVDKVAINYGSPKQVDLDILTLSQAKTYLENGQFGVGSMQPKVQAAVRFVEQTGGKAIITSLGNASKALKGHGGTTVVSS